MGAAASTLLPTRGVGKFSLTPEQEKQNRILSNLFQVLLLKNNLVDLSTLVTSEKSCNDLIVVLSSQLNKEFQQLNFKDPMNPARLQQVSYTSVQAYQGVQNSAERREVCREIAHFLLQFVILVGSLTASISITESVPTRLERILQLPVPDVERPITFSAIQPSVLTDLVSSQFAVKIDEAGSTYMVGSKYYLNTAGYLYSSGSTEGKSKMLGIKFLFKSSAERRPPTGLSEMGYTSRGEPLRPTSSTSSTIGAPSTGQPYSQAQIFAQREDQIRRNLEKKYEDELKRVRNTEEARRRNLADKLQVVAAQRGGPIQYQPQPQTQYPVGQMQGTQMVRFEEPQQSKGILRNPLPMIADGRSTSGQTATTNIKAETLITNSSRRSRKSRASDGMSRRGGQYPSSSSSSSYAPSSSSYPSSSDAPYPSSSSSSSYAPSSSSSSSYAPSSSSSYGTSPSASTTVNPDIGNYILVQLYDLMMCPQQSPDNSCFLGEFYMDYQGNTWNTRYLESSYAAPSLSESVPFVNRVESEGFERVKGSPIKLRTESSVGIRKSTTLLSSKEPFGFSMETVEMLKKFGEVFKGSDIQSPAAQRAFLLATESGSVEEKRGTKPLQTSFCSDSWKQKAANEVPAFSLLEALFRDLEGFVGSTAASEKVAFVNEMTSLKAWVSKGGDSNAFENYVFTGVESDPYFQSFCAGQTYVTIDEMKKILLDAYGQLKVLYNKHLQNVVKFVGTLFVVDSQFMKAIYDASVLPSETVLRLHPKFLTSSQGSRVVLQERIQEARRLIGAHYLEVERVYRGALAAVSSKVIQTSPVAARANRRTTRRAARRSTGF